ncbi:8-oxo-dGTP diphosphatase [Roseovarius sp. MBR-154]|jgi:ADP-ribose pyrophosphatase YjhB (NUDIX family)
MTQYPKLAALAVLLRDDQVLLVKRRNEPDAGLWGFPGGHVELGETAMEAAARELYEETGVASHPVRYLTNVDVVDRDRDGSIRFHFLLAAVLCDYCSGNLIAQDDVSDARWWDVADVLDGKLDCSPHVDLVVKMATF